MHPEPAVGDGAIKTCFVFRLRALELKQERSVDQLDEDAAVSTALAICTSLRAAASGSLRLLRSTNFMGFGSFCGARLEHEAEAERNRRAFNRLAVITRRERQRNPQRCSNAEAIRAVLRWAKTKHNGNLNMV